MEMDRNRVEMLRKRYPKGTRLCLDNMEGEPQMPSGLKGEVFYVDDAGQIHVQWENGSALALTEVDSFHKEAAPEKTKKRGKYPGNRGQEVRPDCLASCPSGCLVGGCADCGFCLQ